MRRAGFILGRETLDAPLSPNQWKVFSQSPFGGTTGDMVWIIDAPDIPAKLLSQFNGYLNSTSADSATLRDAPFRDVISYNGTPVYTVQWWASASWDRGLVWNSISENNYSYGRIWYGDGTGSQSVILSSPSESEHAIPIKSSIDGQSGLMTFLAGPFRSCPA